MSYLQLPDGEEFSFDTVSSGRVVVYDFDIGDLEKLLNLTSEQVVTLNGEDMPYKSVRKQMGTIAAYVPKLSDFYLVKERL